MFMELLSEIGNIITSIFSAIWNFLVSVGRIIKNAFLKFMDVLGFFKNPSRMNELKRNKQALAVSIKENLSSGRFNVVNCLYDRSTDEVIDMNTNSAGYENSSFDSRLSNAFGDKDMVVLQ